MVAVIRGLYTPIGHSRTLNFSGAQASALGQLASYHEALHGFLNSSTTFGNSMILAGTLVEAGFGPFEKLVERMVASSRLTHESFATVSALCTSTGGRMDDSLLDGEYLDLLMTFRHVFGHKARPFLATVALTACARAAMQTPIYLQLLGLPCESWPDIALSPPDPRFRSAFRKDTAAAAMAAIDGVLVSSGEVGRRLISGVAPEMEHELTVALGTTIQEALSKASFAVFAEAIETAGFGPKPAYDAERQGLHELIVRIQNFAGPALKTEFRMADGAEDDIDTVLTDYRRETLTLRDAPDPAALMDRQEPIGISIDDFQLPAPERPWLQLVSMPARKLRTLYRIVDGEGVLLRFPEPIVTGLRRTSRRADGSLLINFYLLRAKEFARFTADNPATEVVALVTTSATYDPAWRLEWLTPGGGRINRLPVLIDTDPFMLLRTHSERSPARVFQISMKLDGGSHIEVFCIAADDTPGVLYFAPCSTPYRQAILEYAHRRCPNVTRHQRLDEDWRALLSRLLPRILAEERCFGVEFWT